MKKILSTIVMCVVFSSLSAQTTQQEKQVNNPQPKSEGEIAISGFKAEDYYKDYKPVIIPEYLLLGMLDYNKRFIGMISGNTIDFYSEEKYKLDLMQYFLREWLSIPSEIENNGITFYLKSTEFSEMLDHNFLTENGRKIRTDIFHSYEEICSFLIGCYFQSGGRGEKRYSIHPTFDASLIFSLLLKADCRKILFNKGGTSIGLGSNCTFDFYPSVLLKKYLDELEAIQREIYIKIYGEDVLNNKKELSEEEKEYQKIYEEEMKRQSKVIEDAFTIYEYFK